MYARLNNSIVQKGRKVNKHNLLSDRFVCVFNAHSKVPNFSRIARKFLHIFFRFSTFIHFLPIMGKHMHRQSKHVQFYKLYNVGKMCTFRRCEKSIQSGASTFFERFFNRSSALLFIFESMICLVNVGLFSKLCT